jgi:hypothetical protein
MFKGLYNGAIYRVFASKKQFVQVLNNLIYKNIYQI